MNMPGGVAPTSWVILSGPEPEETKATVGCRGGNSTYPDFSDRVTFFQVKLRVVWPVFAGSDEQWQFYRVSRALDTRYLADPTKHIALTYVPGNFVLQKMLKFRRDQTKISCV